MDSPHLLSLAEQVEAAGGPDRQLDRDIALAVCRGAKPIDQDVRISVWDGNGRTKVTVKPYTASLDAALSLVPAECRFNLNKRPFADGRADGYHAQVWYSRYYATADDMPDAWAATPALALCAAVLKARASQSHSQTERGEGHWLIERRCDPPQWSVESRPHGIGAFYSDVHRAHRFASKHEASEAMRAMSITEKERGEYFVSEHAWIEHD